MPFVTFQQMLRTATPSQLAALEELTRERFDDELRALKAALAAYAKANFNPGQPRDNQGRWVDTGVEGNGGLRWGHNPDGSPLILEPRRTEDDAIEALYPELYLLPFLGAGRIGFAWRSWVLNRREHIKWTLGTHKSPQRWANQMKERDWTPQQITRAIATGKKFPAPNHVNKGNPAIRYQTRIPGRYVVRDEANKQILHFGKAGYKAPTLP